MAKHKLVEKMDIKITGILYLEKGVILVEDVEHEIKDKLEMFDKKEISFSVSTIINEE